MWGKISTGRLSQKKRIKTNQTKTIPKQEFSAQFLTIGGRSGRTAGHAGRTYSPHLSIPRIHSCNPDPGFTLPPRTTTTTSRGILDPCCWDLATLIPGIETHQPRRPFLTDSLTQDGDAIYTNMETCNWQKTRLTSRPTDLTQTENPKGKTLTPKADSRSCHKK